MSSVSWAKTRYALWGVVVAAALSTGACGGSDAAFEGDLNDEQACVPGSSVACTCSDGRTGAQVCSESGDSLGPCICEGSGDEDAGVEDASNGDAQVDEDGGVNDDAGIDGGKDAGNDAGNDDGKDAGDENDPCDGISSFGICADASTVKLCSIPTGQSTPTVVTVRCSQIETCKVDAHGFARCEKLPGKCEPGASECTGTHQARECNAQGTWENYTCPQCSASPLGVMCSSGETGETMSWSGVVTYESKGPNESMTGWMTRGYAYAQGALIYSYRYDDVLGGHVFVDDATVDDYGNFTVDIPNPPGPNDLLVLYAARPNASRTGIEYAIAEPDVPIGEWDVTKPIPEDDSHLWSWAWYSDSLGAPGANLHIGAEHGSGVMQVFDWLRYIHGSTEYFFGKPGTPLVVWMRNNTSWNCGACFSETSAKVSSYGFGAQIWIPMTAQDETYWSDAVTGHEIGHWVMSSYGRSPLEGGPHYLSCPTFPGQAWSEGFATWFSSLARTDSIYYDKQQGTFFWFDIDTRKYGGGYPWQSPKPADGLLQLIDENEVAAMLWELSDTTSSPAFGQPANQIFFDALASPVVKKDWYVPYGRGYKRHTWEVSGGSCGKKNVVETSLPVPMFADYLDALRCEGMTASEIDAVTKPGTRYPYPSASPICN